MHRSCSEKHGNNVDRVLLQFAGLSEVSAALCFRQSQVRADEGGQLPLQDTEEDDGGTA